MERSSWAVVSAEGSREAARSAGAHAGRERPATDVEQECRHVGSQEFQKRVGCVIIGSIRPISRGAGTDPDGAVARPG
jgi:hypothetical protein